VRDVRVTSECECFACIAWRAGVAAGRRAVDSVGIGGGPAHRQDAQMSESLREQRSSEACPDCCAYTNEPCGKHEQRSNEASPKQGGSGDKQGGCSDKAIHVPKTGEQTFWYEAGLEAGLARPCACEGVLRSETAVPLCRECGDTGEVEEDGTGALGYVVKQPCPDCVGTSSQVPKALPDDDLWTQLDAAEYLLIVLDQADPHVEDPVMASRTKGAINALRAACKKARALETGGTP
jgi:hypothetical protein